MIKVKYIGTENIFIPEVGIGLPSGDNIISVTEKQAAGLLRYKKADKNEFEEIKERRPVQIARPEAE